MTTKPQLALRLVELINETAGEAVFQINEWKAVKFIYFKTELFVHRKYDGSPSIGDMQFIYLVAIACAEMAKRGIPNAYMLGATSSSYKYDETDPISTAMAEAQAIIEILEQEKNDA